MEWKNKAAIICKQTAWARVSGAERCRSPPVSAVFQQAVKTPRHMRGRTHSRSDENWSLSKHVAIALRNCNLKEKTGCLSLGKFGIRQSLMFQRDKMASQPLIQAALTFFARSTSRRNHSEGGGIFPALRAKALAHLKSVSSCVTAKDSCVTPSGWELLRI